MASAAYSFDRQMGQQNTLLQSITRGFNAQAATKVKTTNFNPEQRITNLKEERSNARAAATGIDQTKQGIEQTVRQAKGAAHEAVTQYARANDIPASHMMPAATDADPASAANMVISGAMQGLLGGGTYVTFATSANPVMHNMGGSGGGSKRAHQEAVEAQIRAQSGEQEGFDAFKNVSLAQTGNFGGGKKSSIPGLSSEHSSLRLDRAQISMLNTAFEDGHDLDEILSTDPKNTPEWQALDRSERDIKLASANHDHVGQSQNIKLNAQTLEAAAERDDRILGRSEEAGYGLKDDGFSGLKVAGAAQLNDSVHALGLGNKPGYPPPESMRQQIQASLVAAV